MVIDGLSYKLKPKTRVRVSAAEVTAEHRSWLIPDRYVAAMHGSPAAMGRAISFMDSSHILLNVLIKLVLTTLMGRGGPLVKSTPFARRLVGSNPALAAK